MQVQVKIGVTAADEMVEAETLLLEIGEATSANLHQRGSIATCQDKMTADLPVGEHMEAEKGEGDDLVREESVENEQARMEGMVKDIAW